ncbi:PD-(D/E)XK nuclease family protein [uncultured Deefgea sp.]|uniref:PD-(D/E)XK nuclease family protein n=1 Tax=uncultured Deefgea sp. TaxID=1304914 RepID=UPI002606AE73|nr:PD-(D/E)XK nuclease family protein [uncultured Deefgea sp.]
MTNIYNEHYALLSEFDSLPNILGSQSIFDIAGYPHYENISSNILAFYLNPNNEHGLGNLFLSSLMSLADGNEHPQDNIQVSREVSTNKGGRLDIVIETDNVVIGIENKIFHHLNNDLADYSATINKWAEQKKLYSVKIILSIRKEQGSSGFICVTYDEFWSKIRERLGSYVSTSSQKWLLYLVDFMKSIEKLSGGNMEINENDLFFIENGERVDRLLNARNEFIIKLNGRVRELQDKIEKPTSCNKQWIFSKNCLVHDFILSGYSIAFDLYISAKGWELQLFGRDPKSQQYLTELFSTPPLRDKNPSIKGSRYILQHEDLKIDLDTIKGHLLNWMELLITAEKNKISNKTIS